MGSHACKPVLPNTSAVNIQHEATPTESCGELSLARYEGEHWLTARSVPDTSWMHCCRLLPESGTPEVDDSRPWVAIFGVGVAGIGKGFPQRGQQRPHATDLGSRGLGVVATHEIRGRRRHVDVAAAISFVRLPLLRHLWQQHVEVGWLISGLWYGSLAWQWLASSAIMLMLAYISSLSSMTGSIAFLNVSLFKCILWNHVTRWTLSLGCVSSSALLPVILSIRITPKLKTSTLVVTCPVTTYSEARYPKAPASLVLKEPFPSRARWMSPKSATLARRSSPKRMFDGFRSRWINVWRAKL
ncbi:hypothetical protein MLD38_035436 [Melastoma candidum]|uniref:Uncharacterized protein n=1 Tax=Melastoma candidum TaxID=119954 RepID=A0ACB9LH61_9MYRT|nr:hypothetical protein MLD38_035436 [Melastoma candidum]